MIKGKAYHRDCFRIFLFVVLIHTISTYAQKGNYKDVSLFDLEENFHPKDSTAAAAVLYHDGFMDMSYISGWQYDLNVFKRIKIYNSDGYKYATISIPYFTGSNNDASEAIQNVKAYVYNLVNGRIVRGKIKKADIIDNKVNDLWSEVKFTFPNIQKGSIVEYSYTYSSPHITLLPEWEFQSKIPVNYSSYKMIIPKIFGYNERYKGYHPIDKVVEENETSYGGNIKYNALVFKYNAEGIPALKQEAFVNNYDNYISSVQHELAIFKSPGSGKLVDYKTSWKKVAKELEESEWFGSQLKKTNYFKDDLIPIIEKNVPDQEKINLIFDLVKSKIKWNKTSGIFCSDKLKNIYKEESGSIADINIMLTSMLRFAGFNAHPIILSTIDNGAPTSTPSTRFYNYVISGIELSDDRIILMDASDPLAIPDVLPIRCLNFFGRLLRPNYYNKQVELFPKIKSKDNFVMNLNIDDLGEIKGQLRRQYTNHFGYQHRKSYNKVNRQDYVLNLENELGIDILEYKSDFIDEPKKPCVETMSFKLNDASDNIGDKIYLKPLSFLAREENPFKSSVGNRKLPINFTFPRARRYVINMIIPESFSIDYIPDDFQSKILDNKMNYSFKITTTNQGNLQIMITQNINSVILEPENYEDVKQLYDKIVEKETEFIVLSKN